jgi:hypothetical protein
MAFKKPLLSSVKLKSHCAAGNTYDIVVVSNIELHPEGIDIKMRIMLNLPKPVAVMAVSKSAGFFSATQMYGLRHTLSFKTSIII